MTMIAFATYGDHAEIITDSTSYTANGSALRRCSKVRLLPHMDAAVVTQGDGDFGIDAKSIIEQLSAQVGTLDEVVDQAPAWLRSTWADVTREGMEALVFVLGYSPRLERFAAWGMANDRDDFEAFEIFEPWAMPCPWTVRPDPLQVSRFISWDAAAAAHHGVEPRAEEVLASWTARHALTAPESVEEWVALAEMIRTQRALESFAKIYVAGDVFHTRLARGGSSTSRVHTFNDTGGEFLRLIEGTQHPIAQAMDCWCGSGSAYLDCHLAPALDEPCGCRVTGKPFRECCAVDMAALASPEGQAFIASALS